MFDIIAQSSTRIKTGLALLVGLLIVGLLDSFVVMWLLLGGLMIIALYEALKLFGIDSTKIYIYAIAIWLVAFFYPKPEDLVFVVGVVFASILAYTKEFDKRLFIPLLYPIVSYLFILSLYVNFGMKAMLYLLVVVALTDIGAYFVGKRFGKTQFCQTSPNKTIEGVLGGVTFASVFGSFFFVGSGSVVVAFVVSMVVSVASVFGDLFESYLKREANQKDSGDILPGHGGILDRTDGYLFGAIILMVLLRLFGV